jgi:PAS domain S-box-containing protein
MPQAALHKAESARLNALRRLNILDTPSEEAYDDIARLAAELCGVQIALISFVDHDRQWIKSSFGVDLRETPRSHSFCAHAILLPDEPLVVSDATQDACFADNALVTAAPYIRFYAGVVLCTTDGGLPVGTLSVLSDQPHTIDARQLRALSILASQVEKLLQLHELSQRVATSKRIDELKMAEAERELFFNAGIQHYGVADISNGTWIQASANWEKVLGFESEELIGTSFLDAAHPDDCKRYEQNMRQLKAGKAVQGFMGRIRHKDGSYRSIEWNVSPPIPGSTLVYFTANDVTDADHGLLRKIADAVPVLLHVYDTQQQTTIFCNRPMVALLGYSPAEIAVAEDGIAIDLLHPVDLERFSRYRKQLSLGTNDDRFDIDLRFRHADGEYRQLHLSDRVFKRAPDGTVEQTIGTATLWDDLTVLRRYASNLEAANEELEQFAYVASHDLKQPLRGIDNLAQWIVTDSGDLLPAISKGHLLKLRGRVARMERLLDDLLEYSRIGRRSAPVEEFEVGKLIREVAELLAPPAAFRIECIGPMPSMTTERIPLEQIFRNLIGNAIKHRRRDDGTVQISARPIGDFIEFSVTDNGPGIAPKYHERIFRMFHTLRPRDEVEASGMGLALAKKQVEAHGGQITIQSAEEQGTEFRFTWPN